MLSVTVLLGEFFLLVLLQIFGVTSRPDAYMLILIVLFSFAYILDLFRRETYVPVRRALALGYCFRIALLLFDLYGRNIYILPNSGADSEEFYLRATLYAEGLQGRYSTMHIVIGSLFRLLGTSRIYLQFLLLCCSMIALHVADKALRSVDVDLRYRKGVMLILCLLPNFAILSSVFLRESIVTMLLAISILLFVYWWNGNSELFFWEAFVFVFLASMFHSGSIGVAIGYLMIRLLYDRKKQRFHLSLSTVVPSLALVLVLAFFFTNYADVFLGKMSNIETLADVGLTRVSGGSTYGAYVGNSDNIFNMAIYTPIRIIMFQFSPFFWQVRGVSDIIALCFNSSFYIYVWYKTIRYLAAKASKHRLLIIALFIIGLSTSFVFAWGVTNTGTAVRHRDKMVILHAILLGLVQDGYASYVKSNGKRWREC